MFSSGSISTDMSRITPTNHDDFKHVSEFSKSRDFTGSGLARYRSAPSSFLRALMDSSNDNNSSSGDDESDAFLSALMDGPYDLNQKSSYSQMQQYSVKKESSNANGQMAAAYEGIGTYSVGMDSHVDKRNCSNLARQSSSPAGFLNGFGIMEEIRNNTALNHAETSSSAGGLTNPSSNSMFMPSIPEIGHENTGTYSPETGRLRNGKNAIGREYEAPFTSNSWENSSVNRLKRTREVDMSVFSIGNELENQNEETRKRTPGLVHHSSLPNPTSKTASAETFLNFQQDTVIPCQIRAKRGFATHPRSIAERVRRNRISEKMKRLQDLFPNMDKQTNTAEMLDLAVDYIKDLQKQLQVLTETKAKCVCSHNLQ